MMAVEVKTVEQTQAELCAEDKGRGENRELTNWMMVASTDIALKEEQVCR